MKTQAAAVALFLLSAGVVAVMLASLIGLVASESLLFVIAFKAAPFCATGAALLSMRVRREQGDQ